MTKLYTETLVTSELPARTEDKKSFVKATHNRQATLGEVIEAVTPALDVVSPRTEGKRTTAPFVALLNKLESSAVKVEGLVSDVATLTMANNKLSKEVSDLRAELAKADNANKMLASYLDDLVKRIDALEANNDSRAQTMPTADPEPTLAPVKPASRITQELQKRVEGKRSPTIEATEPAPIVLQPLVGEPEELTSSAKIANAVGEPEVADIDDFEGI